MVISGSIATARKAGIGTFPSCVAADFGLFALVLRPALINLLGFPATGALEPAQAAQIGKYGGLLIMTGLLGWAAGGFIFGIFADYIGRVRALMFSIALYSVFTAMQGLS